MNKIGSAYLIVVLIAGLSAIPTYAFTAQTEENRAVTERYLEMVSIVESSDEHGPVFAGTVRNAHDTLDLRWPMMFIVLKKEGRIVGRIRGMISRGWITPRASMDFVVHGPWDMQDEYDPEYSADYDEYSVRLLADVVGDEAPEVLDPGQVKGCSGDHSSYQCDVFGVKESFNITDKWAFIEVANNTNAYVGNVFIQIWFFDDEDSFIGGTRPRSNLDVLLHISPYSTMEFALETLFFEDEHTSADIARWELKKFSYLLGWTDEDEATGVEGMTWGQIKARR